MFSVSIYPSTTAAAQLRGEEECWASSPRQSGSSASGTDMLPVQGEVFPGSYQRAPDEWGSTALPREGTNSPGYFSPKVNTAAFCIETAHLAASQSGKGGKEEKPVKLVLMAYYIIHLLIMHTSTFPPKQFLKLTCNRDGKFEVDANTKHVRGEVRIETTINF